MMSNSDDKGSKTKTGIFYVKNPAGVVVMKEGKETCRYRNVNELIEAHAKGIAALEKEMDTVLANAYKPFPEGE